MPEEKLETTTPPVQQERELLAEITLEEQQHQLGSLGYAEPEITPAPTNAEKNVAEDHVVETNTGNVNLFP